MSTQNPEQATFAIVHRIEVESTPQRLTDAVSTAEGVAAWWSPRTTGTTGVGEILRVRFGDGDHGPDMRIDALDPAKRVVWTCVEGPWKDMRFVFDIQPHPRGAALVFHHEGWLAQDDFYGHCNAKWGYFLAVSLKSYLEQGTGHPHPEDPKI